MSRSPDREEELILQLLEGGFPAGGSTAATAHPPTQDLSTERSLADTLALLAHSLEPIAPSSAAKQGLMRAIRGGETRATSGTSPSLADPARSSRELARRQRWPLALAAGLALCGIGAATFFYGDAQTVRAELARSDSAVRRLTEGETTSRLELARLSRELEELSTRFNLVIQAGAIACPLLPQGKQQAQLASARGVLYIAGDQKHWFLKVSGLPELPAGRVYHFWFLTESGPQSAGSFRTVSNANAELGSPNLPTGILAVALTVEPEGEVSSPTGDRILFGHEKVHLL